MVTMVTRTRHIVIMFMKSWRVSCSLILKMKLVPPSLLRSSNVPSSFWSVLQCLLWYSVSILRTCCSHFFWYCFISFTKFCAPVFSLIHWLFSLSNFVIPRKCLKNFIHAASKCCSSPFFSTQVSLPNFNAALAVMLWILNYVSLFICFPKCLRIVPFIFCIFAIKITFCKSINYFGYPTIGFLEILS